MKSWHDTLLAYSTPAPTRPLPREGSTGRQPGKDCPVFDLGAFEPIGSDQRRGQVKVRLVRQHVPPPRQIVTAKVLGDPPPGRAGKTPPCEASVRAEAIERIRKELGLPEHVHGRVSDREVEKLLALEGDKDRLAPRRWRKS